MGQFEDELGQFEEANLPEIMRLGRTKPLL